MKNTQIKIPATPANRATLSPAMSAAMADVTSRKIITTHQGMDNGMACMMVTDEIMVNDLTAAVVAAFRACSGAVEV